MPDPMQRWLHDFPEQIEQAAELGRKWDLSSVPEPSGIAFLGIGGSAIGATLICELYRGQLRLPVVVSRGSQPPGWLGEGCLAVAISYSGNTEETLEACSIAEAAGASVVSISSGGALAECAGDRPHLLIPVEFAPRAALGYTSLPLIFLLQKVNAVDDVSPDVDELVRVLKALRVDWGDSTGAGMGIARRLFKRFPIIVGCGLTRSVARRFQAQLAENAKAISLTFELPEALHNLLETVHTHTLEPLRPIAVLLEDVEAPRRLRNYLRLCRRSFQDAGVECVSIPAQTGDDLVKMYSLIHKVDWVSYHLAKLKGVDPVGIPLIQTAKETLGQMNSEEGS
jgi:glucose/mannose-6-phosphate isomerase